MTPRTESPEDRLRPVAMAAGDCLPCLLRPGDRLGVALGADDSRGGGADGAAGRGGGSGDPRLCPVADLMYADFAGLTMDQIANRAARSRYMLADQIGVQIVLRTRWAHNGRRRACPQRSSTCAA